MNTVELSILKEGLKVEEITLDKELVITVGRNEDCNITIEYPKISRAHLTLMINANDVIVMDDGSSNGSFIGKKRLEPFKPHPIKDRGKIILADGLYSLELQIQAPSSATDGALDSTLGAGGDNELLQQIARKGKILVGRDNACDKVLESLQVSRKHAKIEQKGDQYLITDLDSKNGTFVNGKKLAPQQATPIEVSSRITIGTYTFFLQSDQLIDASRSGYAIVADQVEKIYAKNKVGLHPASLKIPAQSFVALMGPSGSGKSTLLKALNGANPATRGSVYLRGLQLNQNNFNQLKRSIGYVPQENIIHMDLTLKQTMYYAAKLRMPDDATEDDINNKITEVLDDLGLPLTDSGNSKIKDLSGGQRKRACIAVELLNDPSILFLDEPTSPLDPETINEFLQKIQKLTEKGVTVIMVTHKPSDLQYVDEVIFLSTGGYLNYHGPKEKFADHFGVEGDEILKVYQKLSDPAEGERRYSEWLEENKPISDVPNKEVIENRSESSVLQTFWLTRRYFSIMMSNSGNVTLLLAQPLIIGLLIGSFLEHLQTTVLFLMAISCIWFGVSNSAKEIVKEQAIFKRERMLNLNIGSYTFSKLFVLSTFAVAQSFIFIFTIWLFYYENNDPVDVVYIGTADTIYFGFILFVLTIPSTLLGLLLSSLGKTTDWVLTLVPLILIPQIIFSGFVAPIDSSFKEKVSYLTLGRWGVESLAQLQDDLKEHHDLYDCQCLPPGTPPDDGMACDTTTTGYAINGQKVLTSVYKVDQLYDESDDCRPTEFGLKPVGAVDALTFYQSDKNNKLPERSLKNDDDTDDARGDDSGELFEANTLTNSLFVNIIALLIHTATLLVLLLFTIKYRARIEEWWKQLKQKAG